MESVESISWLVQASHSAYNHLSNQLSLHSPTLTFSCSHAGSVTVMSSDKKRIKKEGEERGEEDSKWLQYNYFCPWTICLRLLHSSLCVIWLLASQQFTFMNGATYRDPFVHREWGWIQCTIIAIQFHSCGLHLQVQHCTIWLCLPSFSTAA